MRRHSETKGRIEIDCHPQSFATTQANQLNINESTTLINTLKKGHRSFAESCHDIQIPKKPQYFKKISKSTYPSTWSSIPECN